MKRRETYNLEFKADLSNTFLKTVSAFANYGGGAILFGVNDQGEPVGLENPIETSLKIENKINDSLKPIPPFHINLNKSDHTIELIVSEGFAKPYLYNSKAYKRSDSSTVEVDRLELNRLVLEGTNQTYENLPSKFQPLTFQVLEEKLKQELNITNLNQDILKTLNLYSDLSGYNIAAELLADLNSFPGLDMVVFGSDIDEFSDRVTIEKVSVLNQLDSAMAYFRKNYSSERIIGGKRQREFLIPENAFREALANAIVHRAWDIRASIHISMYKNRIEIASPGGLPAGLSKEEYLSGQISVLKNPILANVFFRLKYIEMFGTGIRRIQFSYQESIIKPEFKISENSIVVILPLVSSSLNGFDTDEQTVYLFLSKGSPATRLEIENATGFGKAKVIRTLNQLIEKNAVAKIGIGRSTRYSIL